MENKKIIIYIKLRRWIVVRCCMIAFLLVQGIIVKSQTETLTVICNQKGAPDAMKFSELKSVMKGDKQRWRDGTKVTLAIMKTSTDVGKNTARVIYDMSSNELAKYNMFQHFQGISLIQFFSTTTELQNYVAQNPGAIGVIDQPSANNEIKIITIDGKTKFSL